MTQIDSPRQSPDATALVARGYVAICVLIDASVHEALRAAARDCSVLVGPGAPTVKTVAKAADSIAQAGGATVASWHLHRGTSPADRLT